MWIIISVFSSYGSYRLRVLLHPNDSFGRRNRRLRLISFKWLQNTSFCFLKLFIFGNLHFIFHFFFLFYGIILGLKVYGYAAKTIWHFYFTVEFVHKGHLEMYPIMRLIKIYFAFLAFWINSLLKILVCNTFKFVILEFKWRLRILP